MTENKISTINQYGEKLVGLETVPSVKKTKYPTIILVHGFGVTKEECGLFDDMAKALSESGFLVYRFDFSGCGESEGDYKETSLSKLKSDLSVIFEFVKKQPIINELKIGMLGQSFGTSVIVSFEPKIKCLVLMGSIYNPMDHFKKSFGEGYKPNGLSWKKRSTGLKTYVNPQFWKDFNHYDLLESIGKINCPILFIHGEKDQKIPLSESEAYYNIANEPKELNVIKGADHGLKPARQEVYNIVVSWFNKYLI